MAKRTSPKDNINKPWVENYPPLREWLDAHEARCFHQIPVGNSENPSSYWEMYHVEGRMLPFIVEVHANQMGWNIYTPLNSSSVIDTLKDAANRLGVDPTVGLPKP